MFVVQVGFTLYLCYKVSSFLKLRAFAQAAGVAAMNKALGTLYKSGCWMQSSKASMVGKLIFTFLAHYSICASITLADHKRRFALTPKHHMMCHDAFSLVDQASKHVWCENPMSRTNQMQEDFIGKPSRLSRRVSTRNLHTAVMLRSLICYEQSLKASQEDERGLDAYMT